MRDQPIVTGVEIRQVYREGNARQQVPKREQPEAHRVNRKNEPANRRPSDASSASIASQRGPSHAVHYTLCVFPETRAGPSLSGEEMERWRDACAPTDSRNHISRESSIHR